MFVIWNGLGCLVIPVVILGAVAGAAIAQFEPNARWPRMIAVPSCSGPFITSPRAIRVGPGPPCPTGAARGS